MCLDVKEESIRPEELVKENNELYQEDIREVLAHKNMFVKIPCPACEADFSKSKTLFNKNGFSFVVCENCGTVFINPRPSVKLLKLYYSKAKSIKHWNDKIFPASEEYRRKKIFEPRARKVVELCKRFNLENKSLFDVGAGFGTFCEEIRRQKFFEKIVAIEPSPALANTCRKKGLDVI